MKARWLIITVLIAAAAAFGGWTLARRGGATGSQSETGAGDRKVAFYQSAMHPWIKSDKPGNCTICGMKLTPVYEGDQALAVGDNVVSLSTNTINVINVQSAPVQRGSIERAITAVGIAEDDDTKHRFLSAYVDGRIDDLRVNYSGAVVKQGELLARLYSPALLTAEREYRSLLNDTNFQSSPTLKADAQRLRAAGEQRLRALGLSPEQIANLGKGSNSNSVTDIFSPLTGTVVERFAYEGQYVAAGEKLFELADFSHMWFQFDVYEQDLSLLKPGVMAQITTAANPGKVYEAPITFIDPNLNSETRTAKVRVEVENPLVNGPNGKQSFEIPHRVYAEARFAIARTNVLMVPRTAVLNTGSGPVVYVDLGGGNFQQRKVKLGFRGNSEVEITQGVDEGEKVVTSGNMLIDSQAQLNQQSHHAAGVHVDEPVQGTNAPAHEAARSDVKLTDAQAELLKELVTASAAISEGLAQDKFKAFNEHAAKLREQAWHTEQVFPADHAWTAALKKLAATSVFTPAANLEQARAQILPFNNLLAELAMHARTAEPFKSAHVYKCPMADKAVKGAPKTSFWVQLKGPLRNPYFGSEMLTCGSEAAP